MRLLFNDFGDDVEPEFGLRAVRQNPFGIAAIGHVVGSPRGFHVDNRRHRFDTLGIDRFQLFDPADYLVQFAHERFRPLVGNPDPRKVRNLRNRIFVERHADPFADSTDNAGMPRKTAAKLTPGAATGKAGNRCPRAKHHNVCKTSARASANISRSPGRPIVTRIHRLSGSTPGMRMNTPISASP